MRLLVLLSVFCLLAVISAKKHIEENVDPIEETQEQHNVKKYTKEHQKNHHHSHKNKKHFTKAEKPHEAIPEPEPESKNAPLEIPEDEIKLQSDIETNKKAVVDQKKKEQTEDLHLQDLTHEENLKKKKKNHHGAHHAEVLENNKEKNERKLFAEHEAKHTVEEKVIEDSFEPLEVEKKNKARDRKTKDKSRNKKKAYEKKGKGSKKSKDGKNKNKDKKQKNKDKKKY